MKYSVIILILLLIPLVVYADFGVNKVFENIWGAIKHIWNSYLSLWLNNIWQKIYSFLSREVEQRKSDVENEFKKEAQEIKEDMPSVWQRIKNLFK